MFLNFSIFLLLLECYTSNLTFTLLKGKSTRNDYQSIMNAESLAEQSFDNGDFDQHMSLWGNEVTFESPFGSFENDSDGYLGWLKGFYNQTQAMDGTRHLIMNPVITINGNEAQFVGYLQILNKKDGSFMGTSVMNDRFKKTTDGWKFTYRSVAPDQDMTSLQ